MKKLTLLCVASQLAFVPFVSAHQANDVIVRVGATVIAANSHSKTETARDINLDVRESAQVGVTATYMVSDNIGVEVLGALPFSHKLDARVDLQGNQALERAIKATAPFSNNGALPNVVKVKQLPPSVYAQYYFLDKNASVRPYIGAGINYTRFFDAKSYHPNITNLNVKKHSFGPVVNAGVDIKLMDRLYLNAAMWYTQIKTKASFDAFGEKHQVKIKIDPMVYFVGLSFKY